MTGRPNMQSSSDTVDATFTPTAACRSMFGRRKLSWTSGVSQASSHGIVGKSTSGQERLIGSKRPVRSFG